MSFISRSKLMATINFKKSYAPVPPPVKVPVFKKTYTASPDGLPAPVKSMYDKLVDFITVLKTDPRTNTSRLDDWKVSLDGMKADYDEKVDTKEDYDSNLETVKIALVRIARDAERGNLIPAEFKGGRKKTKRSKRSRRKTAKK